MTNQTAALSATARWDRPFVATDGGDVTLLLNLNAPAASDAAERLPVDIAFVLDRSGSMGGQSIQLARQAILTGAARLTDHDRLSLVVYDHEVETLMPLVRAGAATQQALRAILKMVDARGSTDLSGGWLRGCANLADAMPEGGDDRLHRVVLLTDGHANQGITDPEELWRHAGELRSRGVMTTTIGLGTGYDGHLLSEMARAGGGNHAFIERPEQMSRFFAEELDELVTITARNIDLAVTVPDGATFDLYNPYTFETGGTTTHIAVGELPSGAEVEIVGGVTLPPASTGSVYPCAVHLTWKDTAGTTHKDVINVAPIVAAPRVEVEAAPADESVAEAAALQGTARLQRHAALSAQRGDRVAFRAARQQMDQLLRAAPMTPRIMEEQQEVVRYSQISEDTHDPSVALGLADRGYARGRRANRADWRDREDDTDGGTSDR